MTKLDPDVEANSGRLEHLYRNMLLIRLAEEKLGGLARAGTLPGSVHLYIGQEASGVGVCAHLHDRDSITSTHRGHGHYLANGGGLNVAVPATPADAKGLLKSAIRGDNPTIYLEPGGRGGEVGEVSEDPELLVPFGLARTHRAGSDVSVVAIGAMVRPALAASAKLSEVGIEAEIIDPRTLVPLDEAAILASVARTGRLVVVDEARDRCSAASHIAAIAADKGFGLLKAPVKRVTVPDVRMPYAQVLERSVFPEATTIEAAVRMLLE